MVISLEELHAFELARADMLGERPLAPAKLLELARHIAKLAVDDEAWIDRLIAQADAAAVPPRPSRSPHSGPSSTPRRGDADPRHG